MNELILYAAHQLREHGYVPVPLSGKRPVLKEWWIPLPWDRLRFELTRERRNIGILLTGQRLCVIDCDSLEGIEWADQKGLTSPMVNETSRGEHRLFLTDLEH